MQLNAEFTFKESTRLNGYQVWPVRYIHRLISACFAKCGETPFPSDPNISMTRLNLLFYFCFKYYLHQIGVMGRVVWLETDVDIMRPELFFHSCMNYYYLGIECTGISYKAPADALLTVGFRGQVFFLFKKIVLTPQNKLDLIMAPRFCGSVILSQSTYTPEAYLSTGSANCEVSTEHFMMIF